LAKDIGARVSAISEAARGSSVVLFAIPGAAMADAVASLGAVLADKLVIDATNNVRAQTMNSAAAFSTVAPQASYFRAFNTLGWEMFDRPLVGGLAADLFFCGPDGAGRATVEQLITDIGLRPVWVGGPEEVEVVDGVLRLWFTLVMKRGRGRRLALKLIQD
jgi:predicted dinucleotide-binding enzyme